MIPLIGTLLGSKSKKIDLFSLYLIIKDYENINLSRLSLMHYDCILHIKDIEETLSYILLQN